MRTQHELQNDDTFGDAFDNEGSYWADCLPLLFFIFCTICLVGGIYAC